MEDTSNKIKTASNKDENPSKIQHHQEEHNEESEWHQKGGNESSSWHRVMKMKVTKKTERISKTEQSTKTYKVTSDGLHGNPNQTITIDKTILLPANSSDFKTTDDGEKKDASNSNPFESKEPMLEDEDKDIKEDTNIKDEPPKAEETKKKKWWKCCCCIN